MIDMFKLKAGDRLALLDGRTAQVVTNMEDGMWAEVLPIGVDGKVEEGDPELCHAQDIAPMLDAEG